jgi:hypothetical protein
MLALLCSWLVALALFWPQPASAHLDLTAPVSRYGPDVLKTGPCGISGGERSDNISYYEPGETIEVRWVEYIDHPAHYRIAFDQDGDDDFVDPATMTELYSNDAVLLDGIEDKGPADQGYAVTVTLPDVTCDNCTLQVIQVMYDKPPYTTPGNDIYYQCADLVLREGGSADAGTGIDAGTNPSDGSGCHAAKGGVAGFGLLPAVLVLWLARRLATGSGLLV